MWPKESEDQKQEELIGREDEKWTEGLGGEKRGETRQHAK